MAKLRIPSVWQKNNNSKVNSTTSQNIIAADTYYGQQLEAHSEKLQRVQKRIILVAVLRLAAFVAAAIGIYGYIRYSGITNTIIGILFLTCFVILIKWSFRLKDEKALLQKLIFINTNELNILSNQPNGFDDGKIFQSDENYGNDIDLFGQLSLYHLLNRTTTSHGTDQLVTLLQNPLKTKPEIENYQEAIKILSQQTGLRQLITANGLLHGEKEGNLYAIETWLGTRNQLHHAGWVRVIRFVLPVCTIGALLFYWSTDNYIPLGVAVAASWVSIAGFFKYIGTQHALLGKKQAILDQYASILKIFAGVQTGSASLLKDLQADASKAYRSIHKLSKLSGLLDQRLNLVVNAFLNSFLAYDLQCLYALETWKITNKAFFTKWIHCVGSIESLNSLAGFACNNPGFCIPRVS